MTSPASVEAYLAGLPAESRDVLEQLRQTIKAAAPEATELISYQMPGFKAAGRLLVSYAAFRDHYSLFPASEAVRAALGQELTPYLTGKGTISFRMGEPIPHALVAKVVKMRLTEIGAASHR